MKTAKQKIDKKVVFKAVIKYALLFLAMYVCGVANINGVLHPFAFGLLFALVWCNQSPYILCPLYVLAMFLTDLSLFTFLSALFCAFVLLCTYVVHLRLKKPFKVWLLAIYATISQGLQVYFGIAGGVFLPFVICDVLLGVGFMLCCAAFLSAIVVRGFWTKLTACETACAAVVLIAISCGVSVLDVYVFQTIKFVGCLAILMSCYVFGWQTTLAGAAIMGIGCLLPSGDVSFLCAFVLWALAVAAFKTNKRFVPCLAIAVCEVALALAFNIYPNFSYFNFLSTGLALVVFLIVPTRFVDKLSSFFSTGEDRLAMRNIVTRSRDQLSRRFAQLSDVFNEMNKVFRATIQGGLSKEEAKVMLCQELKDKVCRDCPNCAKCHRTNQEETMAAFSKLFASALEREKVAPFDLPSTITRVCERANVLLGQVAQLSDNYKKYAGAMNSIDASKVLVAEQLYGLSGILSKMSKDVGAKMTFDVGLENRIQNELSFSNIVCSDVVVCQHQGGGTTATAVVREDCLAIKKIESIFSKLCKFDMLVCGEEKSPRSGWRVLNITGAPKYDVIFGCSSKCKTGSEQNGDSYSVTRLSEGKFMLALCDGMGSGKKAEKASNLAMGLVENFYKAGFDNDIILSSVNKLLSLGSEDVFSALDLCVVDLEDASCDVIKLGAPEGYVKKLGQTQVLPAGALPLGILGSVTPCMGQILLDEGDTIILCTDGIADSFFGDGDLADFIAKSTSANPQVLADEILAKALENCKGVALDDMTVVCARVFRRG